MAVVNSKNYFGLEMDEMTKEMVIEKYIKEVPEQYRSVRKWYARAYTTDTDINYLISKHALETIEQIKMDNPEKVVDMIIEKADPEGATFLINKNEFFRYMPIEDRGTKDMMCIYMRRVPTGTQIMGFKDWYVEYESWRLSAGGEINHPTDKRLPVIIQFIKIMIFVKCSNVETYFMKPMEKARPPQMADSRWINKSGKEVTLVNADWNRMYIKAEGFKVRGHIRFQRHGEGNKLIKLIWIDSYEKKGYKRTFHNP